MRVLHLLSQRPSLTGSGVTLDAIVRHAGDAGWEQRVVVGVPADNDIPDVGGLDSRHIFGLGFGGSDLPFAVPGMSDVMPYVSTRFSSMFDDEVETYRRAWRGHIRPILEEFRPHVIHSHHVWLMSALLKDLAPGTAVVTHCHATDLRQMELCPHLASNVRRGCARNDAFFVLHGGHAVELGATLGIPDDRIHLIGAGFNDDLFNNHDRDPDPSPALLYIGKYSNAKGLPWLLDAFERVSDRRPELELHIAGDGTGDEAGALRSRMTALAPRVILHGQLPQDRLAAVMRRATVCVLPSFFEGLPLVLVEALACGCRLVSTDLPGIADQLAPRLGSALDMVEPPEMATIDRPVPEALPAFVDRLETALDRAIDAPTIGDQTEALRSFTWNAVFERIERVWKRVIASS